MIEKGNGLGEVFLLGTLLFMGMALMFTLMQFVGDYSPAEIVSLHTKSRIAILAELTCLNVYLLVDYLESRLEE
tara:strand:- start:455 stop:676 length:222 start_codon:yes stop_codon:yes gene_type:complete